ncbi:UGMP family protein, partial [Candidatus Bathyarchaeota archaeon]
MKKSPNKIYCLGIESTADDFGVGISDKKGEILANISDAYIPNTGGIHPREAARHHAKVASDILNKAFVLAEITPSDLDLIAFAQGPGLGP